MKLIIGLTGKIGSGKSTVAQIFKEFGAHVIDADKVGHEVLNQQDVKDSLRKIFGEAIFSGSQIDRKKLSSIVFSSPEKLSLLEQVVHPMIRRKIKDQLSSLSDVIVIDAAILHRLKLDELCDVVVTITAPFDKIVERLKAKGLSEDEIHQRIACQKDVTNSKYVIVNDCDLSSLREKIKNFYNEVIKSKMQELSGEVQV
ncbi:MAG TPA: dephospho-CoA kinase [Pseudothermotoga sp.]|nr:dephospho-CoA kinase [Pseudothermotoga sp.]HOK83978.1 dephospho-CoA kinase [Pseudothermotoga sp.]HPP70961.1 dephospho-CoA kinase [Pseudothermotoga sp.]